jgi:uncharacterized protein (TIRG00374 family)
VPADSSTKSGDSSRDACGTPLLRPAPAAAPSPASRPTLGRPLLRLAAGLAVAAAALWLAFRHADPAGLAAAIRLVDPLWLTASLASVGVTLLAAVARWKLLFYPDHRARGWGPLGRALLLGQAINIVLPLRLGELARMYALRAAEGLAAARVLATIAVERLADLVMLGTATVALFAFAAMPPWLTRPGGTVLLVAGLALAVSFALAWRPDAWLRAGRRAIGFLPVAVRGRIEPHLHHAADGLGALRSPVVSIAVWAVSLLILLLAASTNYLLFRAFGLALPPVAALFLFVVLQVGNTAVWVPGNIGVFHYLTVVALGVYGVDREPALAYAIVLYAVALLPKIVLGAVVMAVGMEGFSFRSALFPQTPGRG